MIRCFLIDNCKSPTTWQVAAVEGQQSLSEGKWYKLRLRLSKSFIHCQVDGSSTMIKVKDRIKKTYEMLFLAGLPNSNQQLILDNNETCFPKVVNFSGCIADLEMNFVTSSGAQSLNITHAQQFGNISESCTEAKSFTLSISDKNSKVLFTVIYNNLCNISFEFQFRTSQAHSFVGKITCPILTALFFLDEGNIKATVRFEGIDRQKADLFHLTSDGASLNNNQWHKITLNAPEEVGVVNLFIDDELRSSHVLGNKIDRSRLANVNKTSYSVLRFGRNARNYPGFCGCLRDVYVNSIPVNFSHHDLSKGISVGKCHNSLKKTPSLIFKKKSENFPPLPSTVVTFVNARSSDSQRYEPTRNPSNSFTAARKKNTSGGNHEILHPTTSLSRSNSHSHIDKVYPIAISLAVGIIMIFIVMMYIFGAGIKARCQKYCGNEPDVEGNTKPDPISVTIPLKDCPPSQLPAQCFQGLRADDLEQGLNNKRTLPASANCDQGNFNTHQNIYRAVKMLDPNPVKAWQDRYLSQASRIPNSNLLTVPQLHFNCAPDSMKTPTRKIFSSNLQEELESSSLALPREYVTMQKQGFGRDQSDTIVNLSNEERGTRLLTVANSLSPKHLSRVYSGHDSLPKTKKATSLSWAYGTRFNRRGSSDTDCSDIDRVIRMRSRGKAIGSEKTSSIPRSLKVLKSSVPEQEGYRGSYRNHYPKGRRLRTFTEEAHMLHSLKEEDREVESGWRPPLSISNRLKVYYTDTYALWGQNRRPSVHEAPERLGDCVTIGSQVRSLDGYTSSCPESINCLSEKDDTGLHIGRCKRLTTYYF